MEKQETMENAKSGITNLFQNAAMDLLNISYYVYLKIISVPGREPELLKFALEQYEQTEPTENAQLEKVFTRDEKDSYEDTYGKNVDGMLEAFLKKGLDSETFYQELWKGIQENPVLETDKEKAFAFYFILIDVRIPYFELEPGIEMSNEEYINIQNELSEEMKRARFILYAPTKQKTARTSRLIHMLDQLGDERQKAVFMAQILNIFGKSVTDNLLSGLIEKGVLEEVKKP